MLVTEKGNPFLLGANRTAEGYNFALDVPEGETVKLLLYKKGGKVPKYILPFPEEEKMGRICAMEVKGISGEAYEYNYEIDGKIYQDPFTYCIREKSISERGQKMCTKCAADFSRKKNIPGRAISRREFPMKIWCFISSM